MKGFKGFNSKLQCAPSGKMFQYEIGKTSAVEGTINLCNRGLHFCEHPLDTWNYYKPLDGSRYAEVEADGVADKTGDDSKRVAQSLTIKAEVKIPDLLKSAVEFVFQRVKPTTGDRAHSATTGDYAHSATTGYSAHSATTGYSAHASVSGKNSIAASLGPHGQAKGAHGCFLVIAEYDDNGDILSVSVDQVDGNKIKADTFYVLKNGKFTEVK